MKSFWDKIEKFRTIITIVTGIIGVMVFFFTRKEGSTLTIYTESSEKISNLPNIKNLKVEFKYNDSTVSNIWKVNLTVLNTGKNILYGHGSLRSFVEDSLELYFNDEFHILNYQILDNDSQANIYKRSNSKIKFDFLQWKPNENVSLSFILNSNVPNIIPQIKIKERNLINCEVKYTNEAVLTGKTEKERYYYRWLYKQYIPDWVSSIARYIILFICGMMSIFSIGIPYMGFEDYIKYNKWNRKYGENFKEYISALNISEQEKLLFLEKPNETSPHIWANFPYPKLEVEQLMTFGQSLLITTIMFIVFGVIFPYAFITFYYL